jgi:TetR/AcrR family transcriptional repressor of nem operon
LARPRNFNEAKALDAATAQFWRHGFGATSTRDLGAAMGLGPASLYNAFGDKRALFRRCLDRYLDGGMRARITRLERELPPRAAIEGFVDEILTLSRNDRRGCMMVNTTLESGPGDREIGDLVGARLQELEAFFLRCLMAGQRDGSIAANRNAADVARLLLAAIIGLRVLARVRPQAELLRGVACEALALLGPHPRDTRCT